MKKYISIDIGGTAIKYGIICENAEIMMKETMKTEAEKGGSAILEKVFVIVEKLQGRIQEKASGICISTAGMVNTEQGAIFYSAPLIPNYTGMQFKKLLEDKFKIPCEVENDVNCAGLAEYRSGAAKGSHVALILTIGTGIGGSIIMDGEVYHGFSNSACEVGYMHMNETEKKWDGYHIFEEAKKGDKLCLLAIDEMVDILGEGIANICYVINPEVVVLGGGIMAQEQFLKERVECAVKRYLVSSIEEHTKIVFAKHQNDAGMLGAFYHFCSLH